jgi:hypothetical protein
MTKAVHDNGGKIVLQLAHAGFFANAKLTGQTPLAPSNVEGFAKSLRKEMTVEDIRDVVKSYGAAASSTVFRSMPPMGIFSASFFLRHSTGETMRMAATSSIGPELWWRYFNKFGKP